MKMGCVREDGMCARRWDVCAKMGCVREDRMCARRYDMCEIQVRENCMREEMMREI